MFEKKEMPSPEDHFEYVSKRIHEYSICEINAKGCSSTVGFFRLKNIEMENDFNSNLDSVYVSTPPIEGKAWARNCLPMLKQELLASLQESGLKDTNRILHRKTFFILRIYKLSRRK